MKNVKDYQLKKCIFMETEEFDRIIKTVFGEEFEADFGLDGISVWSRAEGLSEKEINEGLSEYFDATITSVHVDDFDDMGVWICYIEKGYPHPRYTEKEVAIIVKDGLVQEVYGTDKDIRVRLIDLDETDTEALKLLEDEANCVRAEWHDIWK